MWIRIVYVENEMWNGIKKYENENLVEQNHLKFFEFKFFLNLLQTESKPSDYCPHSIILPQVLNDTTIQHLDHPPKDDRKHNKNENYLLWHVRHFLTHSIHRKFLYRFFLLILKKLKKDQKTFSRLTADIIKINFIAN